MAFPRKLLAPNEDIVLETNPNWSILVPRTSLFLLVLAGCVAVIVLWSSAPVWMGWVLLGVAGVFLLWVLAKVAVWRSTTLVLTNRRVIYRTGLLRRLGREIPLDRVQDVTFSQSIVERIVGAGSLTIESAGSGGDEPFPDIRHPAVVQSLINRLISPPVPGYAGGYAPPGGYQQQQQPTSQPQSRPQPQSQPQPQYGQPQSPPQYPPGQYPPPGPNQPGQYQPQPQQQYPAQQPPQYPQAQYPQGQYPPGQYQQGQYQQGQYAPQPQPQLYPPAQPSPEPYPPPQPYAPAPPSQQPAGQYPQGSQQYVPAPAPVPVPAPSGGLDSLPSSPSEDLKRLDELLRLGVITDAEYETKRREFLQGR